jgi:hypothetical protein
MARAQTYIIDAGGLFFFYLPRYPNISTFKKGNYDQLWYLTKTIPGSLCCRDRKSDTRLSI